jgi:microcystin-dependent protein
MNILADNSGNLSTSAQVPIGAIIMWCGTTAPSGWAMCDGTNGTPDLTGRFIVGINGKNSDNLTTLNIGDMGGEEFHQLTVPEMPSHAHSYGALSNDSSNNGLGGIANGCTVNNTSEMYGTTSVGGDPTNNFVTLTHNNMPPFYALAYIMKIA